MPAKVFAVFTLLALVSNAQDNDKLRHQQELIKGLIEQGMAIPKQLQESVNKLMQQKAKKAGKQLRNQSTNATVPIQGEGTTKMLTKAQANFRNLVFGGIIIFFTLLLVIIALWATIKKKGKFEIPVPVWKGCRWKPIAVEVFDLLQCCAPKETSDQEYTAIEEQEVQHIQQDDLLQVDPDFSESYEKKVDDLVQRNQKDAVFEFLFNKQKADTNWRKHRKMLQGIILVVYVAICTVIPVMRADTVSCSNGFWWETHMPFFGSFVFSKLAEVYLYFKDPTLDGVLPVWQFLVMFLTSFVGYSDGYQDSTSVQIANACAHDPTAHVDHGLAKMLSISMFYSFWSGVVFAQWVLLAVVAFFFDESGAVLAKLVHMDALASVITVPSDKMWTWYAISAVRTFGEDMPQAGQQSAFVIFVKKNPFMIVSIFFSVGCSLKALLDALTRLPSAIGTLELFSQWRKDADVDDDSLREERPEFTFPDGTKYIGQWNGAKRSGKGSQVLPDGSHYDGEWTNDKFHGVGTYVKKGGGPEWINRYEGNWRAGERNGEGTYAIKDRLRYDGQWADNRKNGKGRQEIHNDLVNEFGYKTYVGEWKDDIRCGFGTMEMSAPHMYEGNFENNNRHGRGRLKFVLGEESYILYNGNWRNDHVYSPAEDPSWSLMMLAVNSTKVFYYGTLNEKGERAGPGVLYSESAIEDPAFRRALEAGPGKSTTYIPEAPHKFELYDGQWKNNMPDGAGKQFFPGSHYEGQFVNGKRHGRGTYESTHPLFKYQPLAPRADQPPILNWENDKMHGIAILEDEKYVHENVIFQDGKMAVKIQCNIPEVPPTMF